MSTHSLDGFKVNVGDMVYDVLYGDGRVSELKTGNKFAVTFGTRQAAMTYSDMGISVRYARRTVYWADPILVPPPKQRAVWTMIKPVVVSLINSSRAVFGGANAE